jgi:hypothetical protein
MYIIAEKHLAPEHVLGDQLDELDAAKAEVPQSDWN